MVTIFTFDHGLVKTENRSLLWKPRSHASILIYYIKQLVLVITNSTKFAMLFWLRAQWFEIAPWRELSNLYAKMTTNMASTFSEFVYHKSCANLLGFQNVYRLNRRHYTSLLYLKEKRTRYVGVSTSCRCVSSRTIRLSSFNGLRWKLAKIVLFIHLIWYWVESVMSSVISFSYFTHFSNLNISETNANIYKRFYYFLEFYEIHLYITSQTGKNLTKVPLKKPNASPAYYTTQFPLLDQ